MTQRQDSPDLAHLQRQLDDVDEQIVRLLAQRTDLAREAGLGAGSQDAAIFTPAREAQVVERLGKLAEGRLKPDHIRAIYREIFSVGRDAARPLRIAFLGPRATFGHQTALQRFGSAALYIPCPSHTDVVTEVERGNADYGVIAIENSTGGPVEESQDRLVETRLQVCDEVTIPISQCLLSRGPIDQITTVYAHQQSLQQTRAWAAQNLHGRSLIAVASNGLAAQRAAEEGAGTAAIGPRMGADEYGLSVLAENIQDNPNNYTRFWVVGPTASERPTGNDKTAIVFSIHDRVGTLRDVANVFAERSISLSSIQSRPARHTGWGATWDYLFFFELRGHTSEPHVQDAFKALEPFTVFVKVLGSWPLGVTD